MQIFILLILLLSSCTSSSPPSPSSTLEVIKGRDTDGPRQAIYRIRVPNDWIRRDPLPEESIADSTKALCEFIIAENGQTLRINIHNFPNAMPDQPRIPPMAQVARWQRQFESLSPHLSNTIPQSFGGYTGVLFTGIGQMKGQESMMMGWAMQIALVHFRTLTVVPTGKDPAIYNQLRADVTIKALGPRALMEKHQAAITTFARSFELIEEISHSL